MKFFLIPVLFGWAAVRAIDYSSVPDLTWVPLSTSGGPHSGRAEFTTAYDHLNNVWINGFGCTDPCYSSDTYEFDPVANTWQTTFPFYCRGSSPSDRPSGRCTGAMAFSAKDAVVLHFGWANVGNPPDAWLYDAGKNTWTSKGRHTLGGTYEGFRLVYDETTNHFYTFDATGSSTGRGMYKYSVGANQWTKAQANAAPASNICYAMAVSEKRRAILVVTTAGEDWIYRIDSGRWELLNSNAIIHGPRYRSGLVYDVANDVFLLMGSKDAGRDLFALELDPASESGTWTDITQRMTGFPRPERGESMVYDRTHNVTLINEYSASPRRAAFRYKNAGPTGLSRARPTPRDEVLHCFPNPVTASAVIRWLGGGAPVRTGDLQILTLKGELIQRIPAASEWRWTGLDLLGRPAPAGPYVVRWTGTDGVRTGKIVVSETR